MAEIGIIYHTKSIIEGCDCCKELSEKDLVKITLDGTNQLWPSYIIGEIYCVEKTEDGRIYKIKIEDEDLNGGPMPNSCNLQIACYGELDQFKDQLLDSESEFVQTIVEAVLSQLP